MNRPYTVFAGSPAPLVSSPSSRWCLRWGMPPGILPLPPRRGRPLPPILVISLILCILEATQGWQRFVEVRAMPYRHRVGTNKIRTYPPIATVYVEFFFCSNVCVWSSFANLSISRITSSVRPNSIMDFRNHASRMNRSWMFKNCRFLHYFWSWFAVWYSWSLSFFPYRWPCGRPLLMQKFGIEKRSRNDLMYFLFSAVSSRKKWPHVQ